MSSALHGARVTLINFLAVIGTIPGDEPPPTIPLDKDQAKELLSASAKDGELKVCFAAYDGAFNNSAPVYRVQPLVHQADTVRAVPHLFHHDVELVMPDGDTWSFAIANRHSPA